MNESKDLILEEEISFKLVGLEIEGDKNGSSVEFKLGPGETKFINLKAIEGV